MSKTKDLTAMSIGVALAIVCRFIKIWEMPQGGAVSFTMIPIFFIAVRNGASAGILTGTTYAVLSVMFHGTIFHPLSILLDYLLAFSVLGLAGIFPKNAFGIVLGSIVGVMGRFCFSVLSGAIIFGGFAPHGQNPWVYSVIYNATYLVPQLFIVIAVLLGLYRKYPSVYKN